MATTGPRPTADSTPVAFVIGGIAGFGIGAATAQTPAGRACAVRRADQHVRGGQLLASPREPGASHE